MFLLVLFVMDSFYRDQEVVIVGAGDSACEEAHYLSKLCTKVTMLVRRDEFRASKIMAERVKNTENIEILFNTETDEVLGDGQVVTGVRVKNNKTNEKHEIPATGFFVAIGHKPNTDIFKGLLDLDETGYIINVNQEHLKQMLKVFLFLVMQQIMFIDKQLQQQVQVVWQL